MLSIRVLALCLAVADGAYLHSPSRGSIAPARRGATGRATVPEMVATKEVFSKYLDESPGVQKTLTKVPKMGVDGGAAAAIAATAAAGFALTPSSRIAVNVVGGALSSSLGVFGRKKLVEERKKAAVPAVASLLSDGLAGVSKDSLEAIQKDYGVDKTEFQAQLGELFLAYLDACLGASKVETSELSDLLRLQVVLNLTPAQAGNKVYAAARNLYSRHRAYLEDEGENDSKALLDKFVFLAERILAGDDSEEGYRYETLRLQKLFNILGPEWKATAEKQAMPFYDKALSSAVLDGKAVTAEQLAAVRGSLGITDGCAAGMHLAVLTSFSERLLEPTLGAEAKLSEADNARLVEGSALLGVDPEEIDNALAALTAPLYEASFAEVAAVAPAEVDERIVAQVAGSLTLRQSELRLSDATARALERDGMRAVAASLLAAATKFVRVQNVAAALEEARKLVDYASKMTTLMSATSRVDGDEAEALASVFSGLDRMEAKGSEVLSLYRVFLLSALDGFKMDAADSKALSQLRLLSGISDADSNSIYEAAAGPLFRKAVADAVASGAMDADAKVAVQQALVDLALPEAVTATIKLDVYKEKLSAKTEITKIVNEDEASSLRELRDFLGLSFDTVEPIHAEAFEASYCDSLTSVFKQEGPIPDEYWEGLEQLQVRLGLADATTEALFAKVAKERLAAKAQLAVDALEAKAAADGAAARKEQGASTSEDDKGELNMGLAAGEKMLAEIMGLIRFAEYTRVLQEGGIACTLSGGFEERTLKELYRQFLIEAFSGKSAEANQAIFANMDKLALVAGLDEGTIKLLHDDLGSTIYRQVCNKALKDGAIDAQVRATLDSIKDTLSMDATKCEQLIADSQLFRVSTLVEQMFESSQVTAADSRNVRDVAELLDVDLRDDVGVLTPRLERMYMVELEDLIDSGELTPETTAELAEICEPLHVDEETAGRLLEQTVAKRCAGGLLQAAATLRQNNQAGAIDEIEKLLQFASLVPGMGEVSAKSVSMRERNELALIYQASSLTGGDLDPAAAEKLALLKEVAGIKDAEA